MTALVLQGDAAHLPLPDGSVDLICTSPPYFGQRDYCDGDGSLKGQIGGEETPGEYVAALLTCTREWMRVLKPSGSMFVNLGDKYGGAKSLLGLPWRYAIGCVDDLGLTLRAEIIWAKPNGLPESATDRVCRSHEQVFHLTRRRRYYAAIDEVRESYGVKHAGRSDGMPSPATRAVQRARPMGAGPTQLNGDLSARNPLGKLPGSVWDIIIQPLIIPDRLGVSHFAAFPMELPRRAILGWSPPGGMVLDPFGGTGTTSLVAGALGRTGVSIDRSMSYCRLAQWRTSDPDERARAMNVPKPPPVVAGQGFLFDDLEAS
jgi:site-specific DNA-methyltransferase (cytosine-N4-specific)